jgi:Glycosyl transferase family 2
MRRNNLAVSVIVTAYEREKYLADALASVRQQMIHVDEVIVVKTKGPNDEAIRNDPIVTKLIEVPVGTTIGSMFRVGHDLANGDILSFLDDDDTFEPGKIAWVKRAFVVDPDLVGARHERRGFGDPESLGRWSRTVPVVDREVRIDPNDLGSKYRWLSRHPPLNMSTISVHRHVLGFFDRILSRLESSTDVFTSIAALSVGPILMSPERLSNYRVHESQSRTSSGSAIAIEAERARTVARLFDGEPTSRLSARIREDLLASAPIRLAIGGSGRPTIREWGRYSRLCLRRREPYLFRDGLRVAFGRGS